ncbi:MAG: hypothetical protein R3B93_12285 [Bacteroidia bacterium]
MTATHVSGESKSKNPSESESNPSLFIQISGDNQFFGALFSITPEDPQNDPFTIHGLRTSGEIEGVTPFDSPEINFPDSSQIDIGISDFVPTNSPVTFIFFAEDGDFDPLSISTTWANHPPEG